MGGGSSFIKTTAAGGTGNIPPGTGWSLGAMEQKNMFLVGRKTGCSSLKLYAVAFGFHAHSTNPIFERKGHSPMQKYNHTGICMLFLFLPMKLKGNGIS
ncbi:hypothetical protein XELAEV_18016942mg [Xenopus laevis]|uniref:Uncharacterized protein n=1 Tax=Xenopus laevis TaxID=8355 RepID=A0A974HSC7_XENLA|nr:hypothetical protein XELAEV_18016942mg [Xenopus laevis]